MRRFPSRSHLVTLCPQSSMSHTNPLTVNTHRVRAHKFSPTPAGNTVTVGDRARKQHRQTGVGFPHVRTRSPAAEKTKRYIPTIEDVEFVRCPIHCARRGLCKSMPCGSLNEVGAGANHRCQEWPFQPTETRDVGRDESMNAATRTQASPGAS